MQVPLARWAALLGCVTLLLNRRRRSLVYGREAKGKRSSGTPLDDSRPRPGAEAAATRIAS